MTNMLKQAHEYYEQDQFSEAKLSYRQAFLVTEPTQDDLVELDISERYEKLYYLMNLRNLYPDSSILALEEAVYLCKIGMKSQAMDRFANLIASEEIQEDDLIRLHRTRFYYNMNFVTPNFEILYEDFMFLWNLDGKYRAIAVRNVLRQLNNVEAIPFLEKIQRTLPDRLIELHKLLQSKIEYINREKEYLNQHKIDK